MALSQINLVFGANIAGLTTALKEIEHLIHGLISPVSALRDQFAEVAEVAGITLLVEKIRELGGEMAEIGEHAENMGVALGISAEQYQNLSESMQLVGASGDSLIRAERQLSRAAEEATSQSIGHQADAFRALGIDAKRFSETLRSDPIAALKELAEAATRTGNTSVSGPLGFLLGRGNPDLYAWFSRGAKGIDEMTAKARELGSPSQEMLENLAKLQKQINGAEIAFKNFGIALTDFLSGAGSGYLSWLTEAYERGTRLFTPGHGLPQPGPGAEGRGIFAEHHDIATASDEETRRLEDIRGRESSGNYQAIGPITKYGTPKGAYQILDETWRRWASAAGIDTSKYPTADLAPMAMQDVAALHGFRTEGQTPWISSAARSSFEDVRTLTGAGRSGGPAATSLPDVKVEVDAAEKRQMINTEAIKKDRDDRIKALDDKYKAQEAELELEKQAAHNHDDVIEQIEQHRTALAREHAAERAAIMADAEKKSGGVVKDETPGKAVAELLGVERQALSQEQAAAQRRADIAIALDQTKIKLANEQMQADLRGTQTRLALDQLTIDGATRAETDIVNKHAAAVQEILADEKKLAGDREKLVQEVKNRAIEAEQQRADKVKEIEDKRALEYHKYGEQVSQSIASTASSHIMQVGTGQETAGQALSKIGQEILQKVMENVIQRLIQQTITNLLQQLASDAANTGILATLLSFLVAKPEIAGTTFAGGGIVSAAGGWVVPATTSGGQVARLHDQEMVLPKDISQGMQNMIRSGGGGGGTVNIHAWDTQTGAQALMRNSQSVAGAMRAGWMQGGTSMRAMSYGGRYP